MKYLIISLLFITSLHTRAVEECNDETVDALSPMLKVAEAVKSSPECPNLKKLRGVCAMVGSRMKDKDKDDHLYRTRFLEAACVTGSETEEDKIKKIKDTWAEMENELTCDSSQFDVVKGNILKYAVSTKFEDFIRDAIKWKVNLNRVDPSDNRTVLDYISYHIQKHKGNALEGMFQNYYKLLREAGAKHKSEL